MVKFIDRPKEEIELERKTRDLVEITRQEFEAYHISEPSRSGFCVSSSTGEVEGGFIFTVVPDKSEPMIYLQDPSFPEDKIHRLAVIYEQNWFPDVEFTVVRQYQKP